MTKCWIVISSLTQSVQGDLNGPPGQSLWIFGSVCPILKLHFRMLDLKCNFKIGQTDLMCRRCSKAEENQKHLLVCPTLADKSILNTGYLPQLQDLYSDSKEKIENEVLRFPACKNSSLLLSKLFLQAEILTLNTCSINIFQLES